MPLKQTIKLSDFDFNLPEHLIAQYPSARRTDSRLLVLKNSLIDSTFLDESKMKGGSQRRKAEPLIYKRGLTPFLE